MKTEYRVRRTIRRLREARGLSQEALARKAKVGRVTLVRVESGSQSPTLATAAKIARALGVTLIDLLTQ